MSAPQDQITVRIGDRVYVVVGDHLQTKDTGDIVGSLVYVLSDTAKTVVARSHSCSSGTARIIGGDLFCTIVGDRLHAYDLATKETGGVVGSVVYVLSDTRKS